MKDSPEISIIVAVYKAEAYIRRCLDSIRAQTFTDFEVLLIDDGSPDRSGEICDEYVALDSRFKVLHKKNGGVSSARQCGIDNARGKYSIHVDPDDWVEPDYLEVLYNKITEEDADMCCCNYIDEYKNNSIPSTRVRNLCKSVSSNADVIISNYSTSLCNKLIRHSLYKLFSVNFPIHIDIGEDEYVLRRFISYSLKVVSTEKYLYHVDKISNAQSLTKIYNESIFLREENIVRKLYLSSDKKEIVTDRRLHVGLMAHNVFYYNYMNTSNFVKYFGRYFFDIMTSTIPVWKKVNILFAFMGMGDAVRPVYKRMKNIFLNEIHYSK